MSTSCYARTTPTTSATRMTSGSGLRNIRKAISASILRAEGQFNLSGLRNLRHASKRRRPRPGSRNGAGKRKKPLSKATLKDFLLQQRRRIGRDIASVKPSLLIGIIRVNYLPLDTRPPLDTRSFVAEPTPPDAPIRSRPQPWLLLRTATRGCGLFVERGELYQGVFAIKM